jgi:putative ABC transport system permease protein
MNVLLDDVAFTVSDETDHVVGRCSSIAFIISPLLAALGATDSTAASPAAGDRTIGANSLVVDLQTFENDDAPAVRAITNQPGVAASAGGLNIGGFARHNDIELGLSIAMFDLRDPVAVPNDLADEQLASGGIVLSRKAAQDLGVAPGDEIVLRHPRVSSAGFAWVESTLPVRALHNSPFRFVAYMDLTDRALMGLDGSVNSIKVQAAGPSELAQLRRSTAELPGGASALAASSFSRTMRDVLEIIDDLFVILQLVIAALAFLVAFNASNVAADERRREHATMLAFGMRYRRVISLGIAESVLLGVGGVALGLAFGNIMLAWILGSVFPVAVPDLTVEQSIGFLSYLITTAIGLAAVTLAPVLNLRRLRTMSLPSTLRFVE